eukprot:6187751-Pleurochrysis_carterae.AAC.5
MATHAALLRVPNGASIRASCPAMALFFPIRRQAAALRSNDLLALRCRQCGHQRVGDTSQLLTSSSIHDWDPLDFALVTGQIARLLCPVVKEVLRCITDQIIGPPAKLALIS